MNICFTTTTVLRYSGDSQASFVTEQIKAWKKRFLKDNVFVLAPDDNSNINNKYKNIFWYQYFPIRKWQTLVYPAILVNIKKNKLNVFLLPFLFFSQYKNLSKLVKEKNISIIYAHWAIPQGFVAYLLYKQKQIPYVVHVHSGDARILSKIPIIGPHLLSIIIKNSTKTFCVNKNQKIFLEKYSNKKNIFVMPMGINCPDIHQIKIFKNKIDFLFIGRFTKKKGIFYFLNALRKSQAKKAKICIAGNGELFKEIEEYKNKYNLNIELPGYISGNAKWSRLASCNCFFHTSISDNNDIEGMPVSILEALYLNKKVITTKDSNIHLFEDWNLIRNKIIIVRSEKELINKINNCFLQKKVSSKISINTTMSKYKWDNYVSSFRKTILQK